MYFNSGTFYGHATKPAEACKSRDGKTSFTRFTIGVSRGQGKGDDFINVTCFGRSADAANKGIFKGTGVLVSGRVGVTCYLNKDNQAIGNIKVTASELRINSPKPDENQGSRLDSIDNVEVYDDEEDEEIVF